MHEAVSYRDHRHNQKHVGIRPHQHERKRRQRGSDERKIDADAVVPQIAENALRHKRDKVIDEHQNPDIRALRIGGDDIKRGDLNKKMNQKIESSQRIRFFHSSPSVLCHMGISNNSMCGKELLEVPIY